MAKINKDKSEFSIYEWSYGDVSILDLKNWIDTQIKQGKNKVKLNIIKGYHNDVDDLELMAEE